MVRFDLGPFFQDHTMKFAYYLPLLFIEYGANLQEIMHREVLDVIRFDLV